MARSLCDDGLMNHYGGGLQSATRTNQPRGKPARKIGKLLHALRVLRTLHRILVVPVQSTVRHSFFMGYCVPIAEATHPCIMVSWRSRRSTSQPRHDDRGQFLILYAMQAFVYTTRRAHLLISRRDAWLVCRRTEMHVVDIERFSTQGRWQNSANRDTPEQA